MEEAGVYLDLFPDFVVAVEITLDDGVEHLRDNAGGFRVDGGGVDLGLSLFFFSLLAPAGTRLFLTVRFGLLSGVEVVLTR